jgi:hypothetical protein
MVGLPVLETQECCDEQHGESHCGYHNATSNATSAVTVRGHTVTLNLGLVSDRRK